MRVIDLTRTVTADMPVYPGSEQPKLSPVATHENNVYKETLLSMYSHTGTHIDAPDHVFPNRVSLDRMPPETFVGKALVIDCRDIGNGGVIGKERLERYGALVYEADFLLFNIGWDGLWDKPEYFGDFPCIDDGVIDIIIGGNFKGIGFDVFSLDPVSHDQLKRHRKLFAACDIINIENLCNLHLCPGGLFDFVCLPLKYENADGAPARAVALV